VVFAECSMPFQRAISNRLAISDFSLSAQLKVVSLSLLPAQSLQTSLPPRTWSTGSCFSPARCFCSVRHQLDFSQHEKKKTSSADSFAPAAAHPASRCSSTLLQILGLGGEEERLKHGSHPDGKGWGPITQRGRVQQPPHQLPFTPPFFNFLFKEFRKQDAHKCCAALIFLISLITCDF